MRHASAPFCIWKEPTIVDPTSIGATMRIAIPVNARPKTGAFVMSKIIISHFCGAARYAAEGHYAAKRSRVTESRSSEGVEDGPTGSYARIDVG